MYKVNTYIVQMQLNVCKFCGRFLTFEKKICRMHASPHIMYASIFSLQIIFSECIHDSKSRSLADARIYDRQLLSTLVPRKYAGSDNLFTNYITR